jgi:hypothetical protein
MMNFHYLTDLEMTFFEQILQNPLTRTSTKDLARAESIWWIRISVHLVMKADDFIAMMAKWQRAQLDRAQLDRAQLAQAHHLHLISPPHNNSAESLHVKRMLERRQGH